MVDDHLRVSGEDDVWALGDAAAVPDPRATRPALPAHLAARDPAGKDRWPQRCRLAGRRGAAPFSYKTLGQFVNLGRYKAVARVGSLTFRGFPAWWLARTYHVSQIPGTARKVRAVTDWTIGLPFKRDIAGGRARSATPPLRRRRSTSVPPTSPEPQKYVNGDPV